nr:PREDICTED: uncharacterized protein LOC105677345 [Linepithema humile]
MQTAGMLRGTRVISLLVLVVPPLIGYAYSSPLQYLPSIPGYIPVYIRYGDEPLDQINPDLAEAFGENSVKSLQKIDHTLAHESDNFKDDDINVFLEESSKKHAYPLHVREAEPSFATVSSADSNKPKLLNIYELPDDNDTRPRRRFRGRSRMKKPPPRKVSLLSDAEKEELEKLAIEVEREETKPNELYGPHSRSPHLERPHNRQNAHNFFAPIKGQNPFNEPLIDLPGISKVADFSKSSNDHNIAETDESEPPIKEQRPDNVLSNVDKLLPIDFIDESKIDEDAIPEVDKGKLLPNKQADQSETPQVIDLSQPLEYDDAGLSEVGKNGSPIKVQRPTSILSNVDKLSPIDLPDESKTAEHNKMNDSTKPNDEIATD